MQRLTARRSPKPRHLRKQNFFDFCASESEQKPMIFVFSNEPIDFSDLKEDDDLETHPQNSILNNSADTSRCYIKRPLNAYMLYTRHTRDSVLKAHPNLVRKAFLFIGRRQLLVCRR